MRPYSSEIRKRQLEERVDKIASGCWVWKGGKYASGYGSFSLNGVKEYVHRASFLLFRGSIPEGRIVCHKCDNKLCVNPEHLYAGTHYDNSMDIRRSAITGRFLKDTAAYFIGYSGDD